MFCFGMRVRYVTYRTNALHGRDHQNEKLSEVLSYVIPRADYIFDVILFYRARIFTKNIAM
jgi:hypothetical protein